jgi:hypothetical protein
VSDDARPVVGLVYGEADAVVRSQVPSLLAALQVLGRRTDAALLDRARPVRPAASRLLRTGTVAALAAATGARPITRSHLAGDRGLDALGRRLAGDLVRRRLADAALLCRGARAALVGIAARDALSANVSVPPRVVLQLCGFEDAEFLMGTPRSEADLRERERQTLRQCRFREELACRRADGVLVLSRPMERLLLQRYALDPQRVGRVPSHAAPVPDAERRRGAVRARLGIPESALVLAWCARPAPWQMPDAAIRVFEAVRAVRSDARLFLVTDPAAVAPHLRDREDPHVLVRPAAPGEAAELLCAADYGLILRAEHIVNRTACPVVFGEYLACGVRPVLSPHLGDQSELCHLTGLGLVVGLASPDLAGGAIALDAAKPGTLDAAARERRRAWVHNTISPGHAALRVGEFLDRLDTLRPL